MSDDYYSEDPDVSDCEADLCLPGERYQAAPRPGTLILPVKELVQSAKPGVWNIIKQASVNKVTLSLKDDCLKVAYMKGSGAPSLGKAGGFTLYACPLLKFPSSHAELSYDTFFDPAFAWNKGGKLGLGLFFGAPGASGGKHSTDTASFRMMWRREGDLECYIYRPAGVEQHPEYKRTLNFVGNEKYGDSLFRGCFRASAGKWTKITMFAHLNGFDGSGKPLPDGQLRVTVDNVTHKYEKMIWRLHDNVQISGICGSSFFGGSTADWATPHDTYILHRNVTVSV